MLSTKVDHTRGLCGKPNVPNNTPMITVVEHPAHCQCCESEMEVREMNSISMQQLGMYRLVCPTCP